MILHCRPCILQVRITKTDHRDPLLTVHHMEAVILPGI
jgi:hypothetical protein